ncbi:MAG: hypothetical protein NW224_07130 [Leptolyngbyaceae cyanobacterium bins.302]|nr:hypothetical protein [Leptolyngbyaceae cyanobacterium bins.302]
MVFLKGIAVWLVIILAETLHGTVRTLWLAPLIGDLPARQVSFFTGVGLILAIATLFIPWLHASHAQLLKIGALWAILTLAFEIGLGRFILGYSWERVLADYNLAQGGLMAIGLVILTFAPLIAAKLNKTMLHSNNQNNH